jgi:putative membrane protein
MLTDFLLASLHHLAAFALVAIVACELVLLRPGIDGATAKRIGMLDGFYGLAALLLLVAGFGRVFLGAKGGDFYLGSLAFWAKITLFLGIGCLSILPTLRFMAWRRRVTGIRLGRRWMPTCARPSAISMSRPGSWSCFRSSPPPWRGAISLARETAYRLGAISAARGKDRAMDMAHLGITPVPNAPCARRFLPRAAMS